MKNLVWRAEVTHDGHAVGYQENGWAALPDEDVEKMVEQGTECVMFAKRLEEKKGGKEYTITFTGSITDVDSGEKKEDPPVSVELSADSLVRYLRKAESLSNYLVDWAEDDVQHGKKTGWDHSKAKPSKPKDE